jgi:hypothetical protein
VKVRILQTLPDHLTQDLQDLRQEEPLHLVLKEDLVKTQDLIQRDQLQRGLLEARLSDTRSLRIDRNKLGLLKLDQQHSQLDLLLDLHVAHQIVDLRIPGLHNKLGLQTLDLQQDLPDNGQSLEQKLNRDSKADPAITIANQLTLLQAEVAKEVDLVHLQGARQLDQVEDKKKDYEIYHRIINPWTTQRQFCSELLRRIAVL